ncbi:hypothetical protein M405DRAFT_797309 [Rhizopogon salebrosus TDB-379]|nr:hypothetical protein M405DRAFT_797309 [Rhizopogon salebrosus TDB-379]
MPAVFTFHFLVRFGSYVDECMNASPFDSCLIRLPESIPMLNHLGLWQKVGPYPAQISTFAW